jgi:uncharacterized protein
MDSLNNKYIKLQKCLNKLGSGIIAFSGGLDSTVLTRIAYDCLGKKAIAVTANSPTYTHSDLKEARKIAKRIGIKHLVVHTNEFKNKHFTRNFRNRCYWCKKELFSRLKTIAVHNSIKYILDGTNYSDKFDKRPGLRANKEFGVISPFYTCRFSKKDIRNLAKILGFPFWDKPQGTCLSSRVPFGEEISLKRLKRVEKAENILKDFFGKRALIRARDHRDILRIELENKVWTKLKKSDINKPIRKLKRLGYKYITIDAEGYIPAGLRK